MTQNDIIEWVSTALLILGTIVIYLTWEREDWTKEQRRRRDSAGLDPIDPIKEEDIERWLSESPVRKDKE
jgi:hypothetical protein